MGNLKQKALITLPLTLLSASTFAAINSSYEVSSITLSADHNESLGAPMPFYANGKMQSKLNVTVAFADRYGQPVTVSNDEVKNSISFYLKSNDVQLGRDKDCRYGRDCWGYTYNENDYAHQISGMYRGAESLPNSRVLSTASNKLTAWVYGNEIAQYRQVCAQLVPPRS